MNTLKSSWYEADSMPLLLLEAYVPFAAGSFL
jgi:hypothetical protein